MSIKKVMVIGAGQMGSGIAQVTAEAGLPVILHDVEDKFIQKGLAGITKNFDRAVEKGRMSVVARDAALKLITPSGGIADAAGVDLVVEAIVEKMTVKAKVFSELDAICPPHTILASNTSSLPITEIAAATKRPEKVIGMHFMNPVPVMTLVEIIRGLATDDSVCKAIADLTMKLGKSPVEVRDVPGFVSNRVLQVMINEAVFCVYEGVATPEGVDSVMKLGMNHPMGPLALADLIGLDTVLYILQIMHEGYADSKYRPCPLLRQYVMAGWLGKKVGRGFYTY
ncbi:MAG: 3-hydroxybutyryl-CoA dehydrogenase [Desulfovibrionaceae bacterium]|nr:3-hydroxybutyryl-CoA dehydrogenase [Desulfovibrionaceae bacterium]